MKTQNSNTENPNIFIDPLTDFGFKRLFGTEPNKDLLISFLNEVFQGRRLIADLVYNMQEQTADTRYQGGAIFDLLCTGQDGEQFIIEIQRGRPLNFKKRSVFYTSSLITGQAPRGKREEWAYDTTPVYLVALLEEFLLAGVPHDLFIHPVSLCHEISGEIFYDELGYTFIELRKFVKTDAELESDLDRWLYVLKNMSRLDKIPTFLRKPVFEKLFNIAAYSNLTKEEKTMYDSAQKKRWDNKAVLDYAVKEAVLEAEKKKAIEIAAKLKRQGMSVSQIADASGLSTEEVEKL